MKPKNENVEKVTNGILEMPNDERIQNLWPQNSNRLTFDPTFDPKSVENDKISDRAILGSFWPKKDQMLFDLNFVTGFGILLSFSIS